ncbi:MAG: hypothetical protein ACYCW6_28110 [Candidatus Xenobia bacterium]
MKRILTVEDNPVNVKLGTRDEALAAAFDAYITKPIEERLLLAAVHELLERTSAPGSFQASRPAGASAQVVPPVISPDGGGA